MHDGGWVRACAYNRLQWHGMRVVCTVVHVPNTHNHANQADTTHTCTHTRHRYTLPATFTGVNQQPFTPTLPHHNIVCFFFHITSRTRLRRINLCLQGICGESAERLSSYSRVEHRVAHDVCSARLILMTRFQKKSLDKTMFHERFTLGVGE